LSGEDESVTVVLRVAAELERLGIDYFVGGSVASSVHGRPRTTDDVDLVARKARLVPKGTGHFRTTVA